MAQAAIKELFNTSEEFYHRYYIDDIEGLTYGPISPLSDVVAVCQMPSILTNNNINHPNQLQKPSRDGSRLSHLSVDGITSATQSRTCL